MATCKAIQEPLAAEWEKATRTHEFLRDVNAGAITDARFNTWLAQDYMYVRTFARLLAAMMTTCPEKHLDILVGGMAAIDAEIKWFKEKAKERGINLDKTEYCQFLAALRAAPYSVQATAFWAMEAIYNQAWSGVGENLAHPKFEEFVDRWSNDGFKQYVIDLEASADEALRGATPEEREAAAAAVSKALTLELGFWNMAYEAAPAASKAQGPNLFGALAEMGKGVAAAIKAKADHDMAMFQQANQGGAPKPAEQGA